VDKLETILIIDDDFGVRSVLATYLGDRDYRILEARSGPEGLSLAAKGLPQLILLDINMAGMNGFEVCSRLKEDPATAGIPVIFVSSSPTTQDKVTGFQAGAVDYVTKPFQMIELATRVETHLKVHRQKRELERTSVELREALAGAHLLNRKLVDVNERLREAEALQSQFLATMRNEINNPLSGIMGLAEELGQVALAPEQVAHLAELIRAEAFNLDFQIRNIFCAGELEAGETTPAIALVEVGTLLRDVAQSFRKIAEARAIRLSLEVDPAAEAAPFGTDPRLLGLVLLNLLSNAIKFSEDDGAVAVRAWLENDTLTVAVQDRGVGIREQDREAIFVRFHQLSTGGSRDHLGQGLGLSIVKALVELLNGRLQISGGPGVGSTFTVAIPWGDACGARMFQALADNIFIFEEPEEK
jgi:signal transduction histidine kinase